MKAVSHKRGLVHEVTAIFLIVAMLLTCQILYLPLNTFAASDSNLTSDKYTVNDISGVVSNVPYEDSDVAVFLSNLKVPDGATIELLGDIENDKKGGITGGKVVTGNEAKVTSADRSNVRTYKIEINQQYNAENQFSSLQGANNWFYQEITGGELQDMVWGRPGAHFETWSGSAEFSFAWKNMIHPDVGSQPVRVFKAPKKGKVSIDNNIKRMTPDGKGVQAKVMLNDQVIWPETGEWVPVDTTLITTGSSIEVNKDDLIEFVLDNSGEAAPNTTYWRMVVTYLPQAQQPTAVDLQGDGYIRIPVNGSIKSKYSASVIDQNSEAIPGEAISWSISPEVPGVSVLQDGTVTVDSTAVPGSVNLVASSVSSPSLSKSMNILLKTASEKINNDEANKLILLNSSNVSMLIDYNNKAKIISLKVNDVETLDSNGIVSSAEIPRGTPSIGTGSLAATPAVSVTGDTLTLDGITYSNSNASITETWTFTVYDQEIQWGINRKYMAVNGGTVDIEQKSAGFNFKKDIFDTAFRSDGGSQVLLSPTDRSKILAFDPLDKQYGTTEAGMAYAGGGIDFVNIPNNFILSLQCTSDKNIVSEFYRDQFTLGLKYDNKLNAKEFTHKLHRADYDLGFHCFMPSKGEHSYDPVTVTEQEVYEQNYSIRASTDLNSYYSVGNLPDTSGIDEYKFGRFLSEFGRTSIVDLDGIGGSWNALRLEFSDTMAGQYAVKLMNGMQYTNSNSKTVKALKALVESAIITQKENGHMVGCPEISGQAYNYPNVSEADAAVPMDAAAYINTTRDVAWAQQVKTGIRKALDYRLSKDANNNGLVENEIDNNYGRDMQAWLDVLYIGGEDAYVNALMYSALTEWADIEEKVLKDAEKAEYYREKAAKLKETYNKDIQDGGLWSDSYQSFIGWRFLDGSVKADVKYLHVSAAAVEYGVASKERAREFLFGAFDGYKDIEDWMTKNGAKAYPLNLHPLDKTETVERFLNEWPGWENGQIFPQTTGDMMSAYAKLGSTIPLKYMKNLIDLYFTTGDPMYFDDTFRWDFGTNTFNCNTRMAINVYSAATLITDIFGFKSRFDGLVVNPVLDASLYGSEINYYMRDHKYTIRFDNDKTRTMLVNDGLESVTFQWNNLIPGTEYSISDRNNADGTETQQQVIADADGIVSYVLPDNKERSITLTGDTVTPSPDQDIFKATAGYSDNQGTDNWSYYQLKDSQESQLQWDSSARQWKNAEKDVMISSKLMKPVSDKSAVRRFEAPEAGQINISGNIRLKDMTDSGARVKILKNGIQWWPKSGEQQIKNNPGIGFKGIMNVAAGDTIDFVVSGTETVVWSPVIEYTSDDPGSDEKADMVTMPSFTKDKYEFNSSDGFAFVQGVDNWYYEEYSNGLFKPMHWSAEMNAWQGSETYALVDSKMAHPGNSCDAARVFKAPDSGSIKILGNIKMGANSANGVKVKILKNEDIVYPQSGEWMRLDGSTPSVDTDVILDVEKGDRIAFILNSNGNNSGDTTFWTPAVNYISKVAGRFDSKADFSNEQGKNNWYYREIINGQYKDMTWVPNYSNWTDTWKGSKDFALIFAGEVMHPELGVQVARVFKAPRPGYVSVTGKAFKNEGGDGTKIKVMKNQEQIWPEKDWSLITGQDGAEVAINKLAVNAGDEIAFILDCNGTTENDGTTWAPVIEYVGSVPAQDAPPDDASLKGILLNNGSLSPAFSSETTVYTAEVKNDIASIEVTAQPSSIKAKTRIFSKDGESSTGVISLLEGPNVITIEVTSENGAVKKEYTITINREYVNTYNGWDSFSNQQGKNNWYYREIKKDGDGNDQYSDMTWGDPIQQGWFLWQGSKTMVLMFRDETAKTIIMHPEKDIQPARVFKSPFEGTISISNKITRSAGGNGSKTQIRKNGVKIWPVNDEWQIITGGEVTGNVQVDVKKGDEIQFVVDCNGDDGSVEGISNDGTGWLPVITYLKIASVDITGKTDLVVPEKGAITSKYTAVIKFNNGTVAENLPVNWTIDPSVEGVSVDSTGSVTVGSSTIASSFALTAEVNGVLSRMTVKLIKEPVNPKPQEPKPANPTPNTSSTPGNNTTQIPKPASTTIKVSPEQLRAAIEKAPTDADGIKRVTIKVEEVVGVLSYIQEIPIKALISINTDFSLSVETPAGTAVLSSGALKELKGMGNSTLLLCVSKTQPGSNSKPSVRIDAKLDDKPLQNIKAPITVSMNYTPSADELKNSEHIVVFSVDEKGNKKAVPNGIYNPETGKVTFFTTQFGTYEVSFVKRTFGDLDKVSWAKHAIEVLASRDVIKGTSEGKFSPDESITRADFILLLVKTLGISADFDRNFEDVQPGDYYYEALGIAKKLGITYGTGNNRFNPGDKISRQDIMVMVSKALQVADKKFEIEGAAGLGNYLDADSISAYALNSVAALLREGIIKGSGNSIKPKENATRAETAVIMYKLLNR